MLVKGEKDNKGKPRMDYLPLDLLEPVAEVLASNCKDNGGKYPRDNYRKPIDPNLLIAAILRHLTQIQKALRTEEGSYLVDLESKHTHAAHVASNAIMLIEALNNWEDEE